MLDDLRREGLEGLRDESVHEFSVSTEFAGGEIAADGIGDVRTNLIHDLLELSVGDGTTLLSWSRVRGRRGSHARGRSPSPASGCGIPSGMS